MEYIGEAAACGITKKLRHLIHRDCRGAPSEDAASVVSSAETLLQVFDADDLDEDIIDMMNSETEGTWIGLENTDGPSFADALESELLGEDEGEAEADVTSNPADTVLAGDLMDEDEEDLA